MLHSQVVLLTVVSEDRPRVPEHERFEVEAYGDGFFRVLLHFGFMDEPDVPAALKLCHRTDSISARCVPPTSSAARQ